MHKLVRVFLIAVIFFMGTSRGEALSLALDSVRTWGKFPNFCVDVYRWGDKFFNTYDSTYVRGTGYKFNIKDRVETWTDRYDFDFGDGSRLHMASQPSTSTGFYLTYLAVSVGYDFNVSKWLGSSDPARRRFVFQFNCALFTADLSWITNNTSTRIKSFTYPDGTIYMNTRYDGINTDIFTVSAVYNLNNKRYSQAAAFNYSKLQMRSQGSFFVGATYWTQDINFDITAFPAIIATHVPETWEQAGVKMYHARNRNYALIAGYGYNWVFAPHWNLGVSESPFIGVKDGYINNYRDRQFSFSLFNRARLSVVWNNGHWFAGGVLKIENNLVYDRDHSLLNTVLNGEVAVGYRFNLW